MAAAFCVAPSPRRMTLPRCSPPRPPGFLGFHPITNLGLLPALQQPYILLLYLSSSASPLHQSEHIKHCHMKLLHQLWLQINGLSCVPGARAGWLKWEHSPKYPLIIFYYFQTCFSSRESGLYPKIILMSLQVLLGLVGKEGKRCTAFADAV